MSALTLTESELPALLPLSYVPSSVPGMRNVGRQDITPPELKTAMVKIFRTIVGNIDKIGVEIETMHHRLDGVYVRTVNMQAGDVVVGAIHKKDHIVIISTGSALVVSEELGIVEVVAPVIFHSKAGAYRTVIVQSEMIWTTVHKTAQPIDADYTLVEDELLEVPECYMETMGDL